MNGDVGASRWRREKQQTQRQQELLKPGYYLHYYDHE
jgi:hypothetical protein